MTPQDLQICRSIHTALTSPERESINYLFLEPVDTAIFTDYTQYVTKPMDLRTLLENLDSDKYSTKEEFYADTALIFENAVTFNKGRPNSGFVLTLAKKMNGVFEREKKKLERRSSVAVASEDTVAAAAAAAAVGGGEKKKIKLSLKRSGSSTSAADDGSSNNPTKKKIKLKLNRGKQLPEGVSSSANAANNHGTVSKSVATHTAPSNTTTTLNDFTKMAPMNIKRRAQCYKVLSSLKRRQATNVKHFLKPVNDAKIVKDYKAKIEFPMDLGTISSK